jgi:hypothetical protein
VNRHPRDGDPDRSPLTEQPPLQPTKDAGDNRNIESTDSDECVVAVAEKSSILASL